MRMQKSQRKHELYMKAYHNIANSYTQRVNQGEDPDAAELIHKLIFYGVKAVNTREEPEIKTWDEAQAIFQFADSIIHLIGVLTPLEFMNLFPIEKDFDGHKWGCKDYFSTRDYVRSLDPNKLLGEDALEFMWEYMNDDINDFNVEVMGYMSDLRQMQGKTSLAEEWATINGVKTYTKFKDDTGREFLLDKETGKTIRLNKAKPGRRLKLVK